MRPEQWEAFKRAARREKVDKIPMAMIIDSPWIPGYSGSSTWIIFWIQSLVQCELKIMEGFRM